LTSIVELVAPLMIDCAAAASWEDRSVVVVEVVLVVVVVMLVAPLGCVGQDGIG
jgi:hypothetical protein